MIIVARRCCRAFCTLIVVQVLVAFRLAIPWAYYNPIDLIQYYSTNRISSSTWTSTSTLTSTSSRTHHQPQQHDGAVHSTWLNDHEGAAKKDGHDEVEDNQPQPQPQPLTATTTASTSTFSAMDLEDDATTTTRGELEENSNDVDHVENDIDDIDSDTDEDEQYSDSLAVVFSSGRNNHSLAAKLNNATTATATAAAAAAANSNSNNSSNKNKKPMLVLHVGPPKTGTTTIQTDLWFLRAALQQDNYYCGGKFYVFPAELQTTMLTAYSRRSPLAERSFIMFKNSFCKRLKTSCMRDFLHELDKFHVRGHNVLLSEESYAWLFKTRAHYEVMHQALAANWDVHIVVTYRHFYDWAPSEIFQKWRLDGPNRHVQSWPDPNNSSSPGRSLEHELLFPYKLRTMLRKTPTAPFRIVQRIGDIFPVHILDMHSHDPGSLATQLFCQVLRNTPQTCTESHLRDQAHNATVAVNAHDKYATHFFYDIVATAAAERNMFNTTQYSRIQVREALHIYTVDVLHLNHTSAFDLHCPSSKDLFLLLQGSLYYQEYTFGSMTDAMRTDHRKGFNKRVQSKEYCWVDTITTLQRPQWQYFFHTILDKALDHANMVDSRKNHSIITATKTTLPDGNIR